MNKLTRWLRRIAASIAVIAITGAVSVYALSERTLARAARVEVSPFTGPVPADSASLAEGERIARTRGCFGCHGEQLQGKVFISEPGVATVAAPNLTALRQTGTAELERAIRHGIGLDGRALFAMPSEMYRVLTDEDLGRLIAWLRSLPPATSELPARSIGPLGRVGILLGQVQPSSYYIATETIPAPPSDPALKAGHYVAWSSCTECHGGALQGGATTPALGAVAASYSVEEFAELLRTGIARDGRALGLMGSVARGRLSYLRADEVSSLHAYLRTLPR